MSSKCTLCEAIFPQYSFFESALLAGPLPFALLVQQKPPLETVDLVYKLTNHIPRTMRCIMKFYCNDDITITWHTIKIIGYT